MINVEKKKLHFKGVGGTEMKEHEVTMEFFKEIDPDKSKFAVRPREVFWPKLHSTGISTYTWSRCLLCWRRLRRAPTGTGCLRAS